MRNNTLICRIPGLSERFLLMNDDFMFIGKARPEDFFKEHEDLIIRNIHHKFRNAEQDLSESATVTINDTQGQTDRILIQLSPVGIGSYCKINRQIMHFLSEFQLKSKGKLTRIPGKE